MAAKGKKQYTAVIGFFDENGNTVRGKQTNITASSISDARRKLNSIGRRSVGHTRDSENESGYFIESVKLKGINTRKMRKMT